MPRHTHKLKRITHKNGEKNYFCVLNCQYKVVTKEALGKVVICWRCGNEFEMNEYSIRLAKPHCMRCHVSDTNKIDINPVSSLKQRLSSAKTISEGRVAVIEKDTEDDLL